MRLAYDGLWPKLFNDAPLRQMPLLGLSSEASEAGYPAEANSHDPSQPLETRPHGASATGSGNTWRRSMATGSLEIKSRLKKHSSVAIAPAGKSAQTPHQQ